jgi:hypothetical protein
MNMLRSFRASLVASCIATHAATGFADPAPKQGYVPTEPVAIAVAEAILTPINGAEAVAKQRPFTAELQNGAWFVYGTGPRSYKTGSTIHLTMGGQMLVRIDKYTGALVETGWLK